MLAPSENLQNKREWAGKGRLKKNIQVHAFRVTERKQAEAKGK